VPHPLGLLRVRRERPRRCPAEQLDEVAALHGAYPKATDHGTKYSRLAWVSGAHRNKKVALSCGDGLIFVGNARGTHK